MILSGEISRLYEEGNKIKNIQGNSTPDYDICTRNNGRNIKNQTNEMKVLRKIVRKTKIDRI